MKYIDADKLRKEIKDRLNCNGAFDEVGDSGWAYDEGIRDGYKYILSFLDTLQEPEGLHFIPINRLLQKIPSNKWAGSVNAYAKKLVDCLIREGYLKDAKVVQSYISYMNGNNVPMATMDEQEPEVNLEKEVEKFLDETGAPYFWCNDNEQIEWCKVIARHFYNLGKQSSDNSPKIKGWVARDKNDSLCFWKVKPQRLPGNVWGSSAPMGVYIRLDETLYPSLKWEDEPREVELTIRPL